MPMAACPNNQELQRFLLGNVAEFEAQALERHLDECDRCRHAIAELPAEDDLLCEARSVWTPPGRTPTDARAADMLARLADLVGTVNEQTAPHLAGAAYDAQELCDFLSPPETADELGRLGPYRVLKLLGAGGMGLVFEAEDVQLQRRVALKVIRPTLAASGTARRRFLREARAIAALRHERIVAILQVGEANGLPFLAMPFLPGETLEDRLRRAVRLPSAEVIALGRQIAEGLAAAHDQGLIHRDIKPSNIWLEAIADCGVRIADSQTHNPPSALRAPQFQVKILDFGLVRAAGGDAQVTHSSVIVGTPAYMAPEQAEGQKADPRGDLFSLGCVLYRMSTGEVPFRGASTLETLLSLAKCRVRSPRQLNPEVPPALSDLILHLLARRPEARPPSAQAVVAELDAVAAGRRTPRRWHRLALLAVLFVLGVLGSALVPRSVPEQDQPADNVRAPLRFGPEARYPAGLYPRQVAVGDFDRDGKLDLVVANIHAHSVSLLRGQGDGSFGAPRSFPAGQWFAWTVNAADLNGDGRLDLAIVNHGNHKVSVVHGNGDGTFAAPVQYSVGDSPIDLAVGDFNRDGRTDLAVSFTGGVGVLLGESGGQLAPAVRYSTGGNPGPLTAVDLNGDGRLDLVLSMVEVGAVSVLLGKGDGTFADPVLHGSGPRQVRTAPLAGDLNGDGRLDLVVRDQQGSRVLLGQGDGSLAADRLLSADASPLALADFDGDGKLDAILGTSADGLWLYLGNGDGTFRAGGNLGGVTPNSSNLATGDFNGDGALDLAIPNEQTNDVAVRLNQTSSSRRHLGPAAFFACGKEPAAVAVGDFNADGVPDVAVANAGDDTVSVLRGHEGGYAPHVAYPCGKRPSAVVVGDVNRDGRPDLIVACQGENCVKVLLGNPDGTFAPAASYGVGKGPISLTLVDLDRDGRLDLVSVEGDGSTVSVLRGRGDGSFGPTVSQAVAAKPFFVTSADLNRDGRADLVIAHRDQVGQVTLLLGAGDGGFGPPVVLAAGSYPQSVAVQDFNRDGRLDLAVGNWALGDVNLFLGNGDGTFRNPVNHFIAGQAYAVLAGDFDNDGRSDLVASDPLGGQVRLQRGTGAGTFEHNTSASGVGLKPSQLAVADLDSDGRLDAIVVNSQSHAIAVLRNRPAGPALAVSCASGSKALAGTPIALRVQALLQDSRPDKGYGGTISLRSSDPRASLPADHTFTDTDQGSREFTPVLKSAGVQTVTVEDRSGGVRADSYTFGVLGLDDLEYRLEVPAEVSAGKPFTVTLNVMEKGGGWINNYAGTVRFTCTDATAELPGNYRFAGTEGHHTFTSGLTLSKPGPHTITVTDVGHPSLTGRATVTVKGPSGP